VALQLEVAEGRPLPVEQSEIAVCGWSVEARLYAEDPARDFAPCTGAVGLWRVPNMEGIRVDTGVETGAEVGIHYDPMLAKIIAAGPTRAIAIRRLQAALKQLVCLGLQTNRTYLQGVLSHPAFVAGTLHTRFLAEHADALSDDAPPVAEALAAAVVSDWAFAQSARRRLPGIAPNWRNNRWRDPRHSYRHQDVDHEVSWHQDRDTLLVGGRSVRVLSWDSPLHLEIDGIAQFCDVVSRSDGLWVQVGAHDVYLERVPDFIIPGLDVSAGGCVAPMPGKVVEVCVVVGDAVQKGDKLIVLEAMKMEQAIKAAEPGTVTAVHVDQGDQVELGAVLIELLGVSEES
jgi:propionyl-CoA carboxylase alpha chain